MPWKEITKMSQKEEFIRQVLIKAKPFSVLCEEFNISRKTGYKILKRYRCEGLEGLKPHPTIPLSNPNKTPKEIVKKIFSIRSKGCRQYPDEYFYKELGLICLQALQH